MFKKPVRLALWSVAALLLISFLGGSVIWSMLGLADDLSIVRRFAGGA